MTRIPGVSNRNVSRALSFVQDSAERVGLSVARHSSDREWLGINRRPFDLIIDVGANRGQFIRRSLADLRTGRYVCIDPLPIVQNDLKSMAAEFPGVEFGFHQVALGDESGETTLRVHDDHDVSSSLLATAAEGRHLHPEAEETSEIVVQVERLDDLVDLGTAPGRVLLKIDAQGFEDRILRGAQAVLRATDACILEYSVADLYEEQAQFPALVELTAAAGLRFAGTLDQVHTDAGSLSYCDLLFVRPTPNTEL